MINMNTAVMHDSPIAFPGLFGDWTFTASSKAINIGGGVYWYGIIIAFKNYKGAAGGFEAIMKAPWIGLKHFQIFFKSIYCL